MPRRQKNKDELRAKEFLESLGFKTLSHEPLGNVTPDFLANNKIAIEVRRLTRNFINSDKLINIENDTIVLIKKIKKHIENYRSENFSHSSYVSLSFIKDIDIQSKNNILKKFKKLLKKNEQTLKREKTFTISKVLQVTLTPTNKKSKKYIFTGCDGDYLWLVHHLHRIIQSDIDEKNKKIKKNYPLYPEWWLILVDSIIYGLDDEDFEALKHIRPQKKKFAKVIILSAKGELRSFAF